MISVDNLTVSFGGWDLFKDISFLINPKDRIGLVGKNGAGKSTMLKVLTGEQPPSSGGVSRNGDCTIGYLPQQMKVADTTTLYAETEAAFGEVIDLEKEIAHLTEQITVRTDYESKEYETLLHRLNDCNDRFQILGGLNREAEIEKTLLGLGFKRSDFTRATSEFSGGWRMRIELAKLLLRRPSLFLLDEPTNHLDIESIEWLESYLKEYNGAVVLISHDRAFLDNVTTMLLIAPVTIEVCGIMKMSPIPFLLPEVMYSNIGGTATQIGDPPNIIIGNMLKEHIGFIDFIKNCTPCVLLCMVFVYPFVFLYYRKDLTMPDFKIDTSLREKYQIKNKPLLVKCGTVLATVIILFFMHSFHHIDTAFLAIAGAFACLFLGTNDDLHTTFELLEWETLVFFAGLFIMIEGINELGVIRAIGNGVSSLIEKAPVKWQSWVAHMLILWVSGLASSVLDNIAFTATMIPIIQILAEHPELSGVVWAL